jgi:hypothetical protein
MVRRRFHDVQPRLARRNGLPVSEGILYGMLTEHGFKVGRRRENRGPLGYDDRAA